MSTPAAGLSPLCEAIARRLYEHDGSGLAGAPEWEGDRLDGEHPGLRERYRARAEALLDGPLKDFIAGLERGDRLRGEMEEELRVLRRQRIAAERERELLEANNRMLDRARKADAARAGTEARAEDPGTGAGRRPRGGSVLAAIRLRCRRPRHPAPRGGGGVAGGGRARGDPRAGAAGARRGGAEALRRPGRHDAEGGLDLGPPGLEPRPAALVVPRRPGRPAAGRARRRLQAAGGGPARRTRGRLMRSAGRNRAPR